MRPHLSASSTSLTVLGLAVSLFYSGCHSTGVASPPQIFQPTLSSPYQANYPPQSQGQWMNPPFGNQQLGNQQLGNQQNASYAPGAYSQTPANTGQNAWFGAWNPGQWNPSGLNPFSGGQSTC